MVRTTVKEVLDAMRQEQSEVIAPPFPERLTRLMSGDPRAIQTEKLWERGFGESFDSFEDYLATIPKIPKKLKADDERFPLLVLVDTRLGVTKSFKLAGLNYTADDQACREDVIGGLNYDPDDEICRENVIEAKKARTEQVYWMRCHDGRKSRKKMRSIRNELDLTAKEGIAIYIQNPKVIEGHHLHFIGSYFHNEPGFEPYLGHGCDGPGLYWLYLYLDDYFPRRATRRK